tara:strand:+ start:1145 stop:1882 length:738 start_codon:yes stop_codon:yes gene_type:complete
MNITIKSISDQGKVRSNNQDSTLINLTIPKTNNHITGFSGIADGMGGLEMGEVASKESLRFVETEISKLTPWDRSNDITPLDYYTKYFLEINEGVHDHIRKMCMENNVQMGTTLTYGIFQDDKFYYSHIGDTRIYTIKKPGFFKNKLRMNQITQDDNPEGRSSILTKFIGGEDTYDPQIGEVSLSEISYLFFSTDGLHDLVPNEDIISSFHSEAGLTNINEELVKKANENGGRDNISLINISIYD